MKSVQVVLDGRPVPWARVKSSGRHAYNPAKQMHHRHELAVLMRAAAVHRGTLLHPIALDMTFEYLGRSGGRTIVEISKPEIDDGYVKVPDLDNLQKQVLEALELSQLVRSDSQVVEIHARKILKGKRT